MGVVDASSIGWADIRRSPVDAGIRRVAKAVDALR
jgi:hypothetical protein